MDSAEPIFVFMEIIIIGNRNKVWGLDWGIMNKQKQQKQNKTKQKQKQNKQTNKTKQNKNTIIT